MTKRYTDEFLISELKRFHSEYDKVPTIKDFRTNINYPSVNVYKRHFKSWNNALIMAELNVRSKYTKEELLNALQRFYKENNKVPSSNDFINNKDFPGTTTYVKYFKSWNNALKEAGFDGYKKYTDEELLDELKRFYFEYNKVPTERDFRSNKNFPSDTSYKIHFGSWNNALKLVNFDINKISKLTGHEICYICKTDKTSDWYLKDDKRICNKCHYDRRYFCGTLDPNSKTGMGVITEQVVYKVLNDCIKCNTMDDFCSDYDLISEKYGNINVKSSTLRKYTHSKSYYWDFRIHKNSKIPNNYVCIGFNENKTEILKVWIMTGESELINKTGIWITNSKNGLKRFEKCETNPAPYNNTYQDLNITTLPEFRNWDFNNFLEIEVI